MEISMKRVDHANAAKSNIEIVAKNTIQLMIFFLTNAMIPLLNSNDLWHTNK